jgi:hypothetical protein
MFSVLDNGCRYYMDACLLVGIPNNFDKEDNMHNVSIEIYITY